jgi:3'-phosphoadenosine 5'-phosphosulfate sulfotransferase (PAPS reductase)/FAD synthetase
MASAQSSSRLDAFRDRADTVLEKAATDYEFDTILAAVSGGTDSQTALDVAARSDAIDLDGVVFIDTGVHIPAVKEWVKAQAEQRGLPFYSTDETHRLPQEQYQRLSTVYGFPGPPVHDTQFQNLKSKRVSRLLSEFDGKVGLISGVMEAESDRRKMNIDDEPIDEQGSKAWISPLFDWPIAVVGEYRDYHGLEACEVGSALEVSGDCLCAAYGDRYELIEIAGWAPDVGEQLAEIELEVVRRVQQGQLRPDHALWGHGNTDGQDLDARTDPDQAILCSTCEQRGSVPYDCSGDPLTTAEAHHRHETNLLRSLYPVYCPLCDIVTEDGQEHVEAVHSDANVTDLNTRIIPVRERAAHQDEPGRPQIPLASAAYTTAEYRITQGEITTRTPDGAFCDESHDFTPVQSRRDRAVAHCQNCGAYKIRTEYDRPHSWHPYLTAVPSPREDWPAPDTQRSQKSQTVEAPVSAQLSDF